MFKKKKKNILIMYLFCKILQLLKIKSSPHSFEFVILSDFLKTVFNLIWEMF
jgi:hypothetical protein